jgi:Calx-beta domain/FG-GAP-like repeat/FG-GAP repeat
MPRQVKSHALFLCGILAAFLISGAQRVSAADACSPAALKVARSFDVGSNGGLTPLAFAAADFNGDGRPDFAATDAEGNSVAVLLNDGTGWFAAPVKFAVGTRPSSVAVADLNADGQPDLFVTNSGSNNVSVLLGGGGGVFGPASNFAVGADPRAAAFGDFNGDSKLDAAVANVGGHSVTILLGNGAGSFSQTGSPVNVAGDPIAVAVADFNSDSKRDLVVATFGGFFVALGDGAGGFSAAAQVYAPAGTAVAAADVNGDGKSDLILGSTGLVVLTGDGAGGFSAPTVFSREGNGDVSTLALGDLDGDGKLDVAVTGSPTGVGYFKGNGAGSFSRTRSYLADNNPNSLALGDFDGDGKLDIATGGNAYNTRPLTDISVLKNNGGDFEAAQAVYTPPPSATSITSGTPFDIAKGDFNADGREDLAVLHRPQFSPDFQGARVTILLRDASGDFAPSASVVYFNGSFLNQVIAADFNKDGKTDVAVAATISQPFSHVVSVSLSNGDGTFAAPNNVNVSSFAAEPVSIAAGDFNNDGNPDIIVVSRQAGGVAVLLGDGAGNFSLSPGGTPSIGTSFDAVAAGDFNNDSLTDAVVTDSTRQRVLVLLSAGGGVFAAPQAFNVGGFPSAVVVGDFNLDGKADIAASNHLAPSAFGFTDDGSAAVLLGNGAGGFAAAVNYRAGVQPDDIVTGDFDGDGKPDLAVANAQSSTVSLLSGDGAGAFAPASTYGIAGAPAALAAHDFDGDGRTDIAAALPGARASGVLYARPPAALPCLFADDATVTEGDSGTTDAQVNVRLSGPSAQVVKVNYVVRGNPAAIEGQDFAPTAGTLTFQPGETAKTVSVPVFGDALNEDPESFTLHLSGAAGARVSDGVAKVSVIDNDPQPSISISDATAAEKDSSFDTSDAVFTVTLSAPSSKSVGVNYATADGTATANGDYGRVQRTLVFGPGETSKTITVAVQGDQTHEPDETFFVNLSNAVNATVADAQAQGTIIDNDPVPSVTIFNLSAFEPGGVADAAATFTLRLSNPSSAPVTFDYATADGTANAGSDYLAATGTVTFNPGETDKTINVTVKDDAIDEIDETFFVNLSNPVNATVADGQSLCTIFDNDGPTVSINDVTVNEGQSGRTSATFTLTLSAPSVQDVFVVAATANGTAAGNTFPADFQRFNFSPVVIPAGSTTGTVTVFVNGDIIIEPDETFFVNLSQPQNATIADAQGLGTILNDDLTSVQFSTNSATVSEANGSVQLTVNRVGDLSVPLTAFYATFDGTASERSDYTAALGTLRFAPGEATKTLTVLITDDALVESPETFIVSLTGRDGAPTNQPSAVVVTINSDDAVAGPNPVDSSAFFVRQHYRDFLSREADASGLAFWTNEIESCGANQQCRDVKRVNVSAAFFLSIEFQETGYLVYRFYKAAYGDATSPGVAGTVPVVPIGAFQADSRSISEGVIVNVGDWQAQLENNKRTFALDFVGRDTFLAAYPSTMSAGEFVSKLDQNAGGVLTAQDKAQLAAVLGSTPSDASKRAQVVRSVAENSALSRNEFNRAFVLMQYFGYLRRNPSDEPDADFRGWKFWLDKLNQFQGNFVAAEMVKAFISSDEYRKRFGQ